MAEVQVRGQVFMNSGSNSFTGRISLDRGAIRGAAWLGFLLSLFPVTVISVIILKTWIAYRELESEHLIMLAVLPVLLFLSGRMLSDCINEFCRVRIEEDGVSFKYILGDPVLLDWSKIEFVAIKEEPYSDGKVFTFKQIILVRINSPRKSRKKENYNTRSFISVFFDYSDELKDILRQKYPGEIIDERLFTKYGNNSESWYSVS